MKLPMQDQTAGRSTRDNDATCGLAMFGIMVILGGLSIVSAIVYTVVASNVAISGHYKYQQNSFFQADASIQYVRARLNADLRSGAVTLAGPVTTVNYSAPSSYNFDPVTELVQLANSNLYMFTVTGRARTSSTVIEAVIGQENALSNLGIFGDLDLRLQPNFDVYSYRSDALLNPTPADSTGQAGIGSNISVTIQPGTTLDGTVFIGKSPSEVQGTYSGPGTIPVEYIDRIAPDPLGAIGGPLATSFLHYSDASNNDNIAGGIVNNVIDVPNHDTFTLYSGIYYLTDFFLGSASTLAIESTPDDPAVVYLTGEFRSQPNTIIASTSGSPAAFYLFSNSSDPIVAQPDSDFHGFVYAPYSGVVIQPNSRAMGVFWGETIRLQPNGDLYIDNRLLDDFLSGTMKLVQWKEIR